MSRRLSKMHSFEPRATYLFYVLLASTTVTAIPSTQRFPWPPSLPRCFRNDPHFPQCLIMATLDAVPKFAKGIPELGVQPIDPLSTRIATLDSGPTRRPITLRATMENISIFGPSNMIIKSLKFDWATYRLSLITYHKAIRIVGSYRATGNIFLFPINSQGTFDMEIRGVLANQSLTILPNKNDRDHGRVHYQLLDLGHMSLMMHDPRHGFAAARAFNRLINDNWRAIAKALTPSTEKMIEDSGSESLASFFSKFSVDDVFPVGYPSRAFGLNPLGIQMQHSGSVFNPWTWT